MTVLLLIAALLAQEVAPTPSRGAPTPSKPPRSLAAYEVESRPRSDRESTRSMPDDVPVATSRSLEMKPLFVAHGSELAALDGGEPSSTPTARLLASLVEEEARAFDPSVRCVARGSTVFVDSTAAEEAHVRELLQSASVTSRERCVALEVRFLTLGPKSCDALTRSGIACDALDGGARVQESKLTAAEINQLLREDGEVISGPRVVVSDGEPFAHHVFHGPSASKVRVVTAWDPVYVEEIGWVLSPRITEFEEGEGVHGAALVVARPAERGGGDRIALDLDLSTLAVGRPIPQEKRVVEGKEVVVQLPTVKQSSLHALLTLAPEQRVIVAGLTRPTFKAGETPRPILLEVVARGVAAGEGR